MASPRAIIGLRRLAPKASQCVLNISPKTPVRNSLNFGIGTNEELCRSFNIDTPNRMKILNDGLSDCTRNILGSGGFGTVIQASYKGDQVAAKIIRRRKNNDTSVNAEKHATYLRHDNIVRILGIEQGTALSMITMELCGKSLQEMLDERELKCRERISIFKAVSIALQFCHYAGVVHADIKPKNVLFGTDGKPKLADFGSSFLLGEVVERTGLRGTPGYAAPEIISGELPSPAADIYSLGVMAWQMLSRKLPFAGYHSHTIVYFTGKGMKPEDDEVDDDLSGRYKALYRNMWSFNKVERPDIDTVLIELENLETVA